MGEDAASDIQSVTIIGLGKMGLPMALRLLSKSISITGVDVNEDALANLRRAGGHAASSPAAAVSGTGIVITMLPDSRAVDSVILSGPDPVAAHMENGALLVDMSSSSPMETKRIGQALADRGIGMIDAPVSGGVKRAASGTLAIMVGGDQAAVERARPILQALGTSIFPTGPLGSGHAMKALNNFVSAIGLAASCEALQIGARFGLNPEVMTDILNASTGRNNSTENKIKQFVVSGSYDGGFALGLMAKDLRTAAELADDVGSTAPLCHETSRLWGEALSRLGPRADHSEIDRYLKSLDA